MAGINARRGPGPIAGCLSGMTETRYRGWPRAAGAALIAWPTLHFLGFLTSPPGETHEPPLYREHATLVQVSCRAATASHRRRR